MSGFIKKLIKGINKAIEIDPYLQSGIRPEGTGQRAGSIVQSGSSVPLPNIPTSNLPFGGQSNVQQALALDTISPFNEGGIVSAKKNF